MKKLWITSLAICLTLMSAGCSGSSLPKAETAPAPTANEKKDTKETPAAVKEVRVSWYGDANRTKVYNDTFDIIQKKLPHIKIIREFASSAEYWNKLNTQVAGGNAPDLMVFTLDNINDFAKRNQLLDLQPFVDQGVIDIKSFNPTIVDSGKVNGKLYSVSQGNSIKASYYNKAMFKKAGVSEPSFDWTWEDYSRSMIAIHDALGKTVWGSEDMGGTSNLMQAFFKQRGKDLYKEDGSLGFEKADMIDWFTIWDTMRQKGGIPPADVSAEYAGKNEVEGILASGKVAATMSSSNRMKLFQDVMKDELGIVRVPTTKGGTEFDLLAGVYSSIYVKSKVAKETAEIINLFVNDLEAAKVFGELYGPVGSTKIMKDIEPFIDPSLKKVNEFQIAVSKNALPTVAYPTGSNAVNKLISTANEAIGFKQKSVSQAVDDFFVEAQKILKK
ncbi:multiple sugar transport system substrate-binding protein [Paenibacillus sp. 1_12]|uniref:ABC transporter substrate-binding protein n=1 Tax=Paenibacillus sp. 1_12 TaxID=1566278 RepID=UPI0008E54821|nr:extracellular solute-binding protein [Paenibacillus sp. 1_12]SFK99567.1 multiple sugar transport system substrate-binding protein [Paenibacillus sp. 1_12]